MLVGHDHWDHALDVPLVAQLTGAPLLGGLGLVRRLRDQGFPVDRLIGVHSFTGLARGGDVDTFAFVVRLGGREILVLDTANYIERELEGLRPDVAIVAPGGREKVHDYSCRVLRAPGHHRGCFPHISTTSSAAGDPLDAESQADLTSCAAEVHACSPRTEVTIPRPFVPLTFSAG